MESHQLLRLQHTDLRPGCEPAGQIPGHDEGTKLPTPNRTRHWTLENTYSSTAGSTYILVGV